MPQSSDTTVLPTGVQTQDHPEGTSVGFDIEAFDTAIAAHGVELVHYRAFINPVGMIDKYDSRRPNPDHSGASNGMQYIKVGCLSALMIGNSKELKAWTGGVLHGGMAQITPARFYKDGKTRVRLHERDRLYLATESTLVLHQQLVEAHETGRDRLQFPVVEVQDVMDADGIMYKCGDDFQIVEGDIVWNQGKGPRANIELTVGKVYGIRYLYRPHWYVDHLTHEIRVAQYVDMLGARHVEQMPQCAIVAREYVYLNENNDEKVPNPKPSRQVQAPRNDYFGPR